MTHQTDVDVLIVGAGPSGLTMACLLAHFGVKFRIIEKNEKINNKSKALAIQARTLELFEQLGVTSKAIRMGHPAEGVDLIIQGRPRASIDLRAFGAGLTKYPYLLILEQYKTERLLGDTLRSLGARVERDKKLIDFQQHPDSISAAILVSGRIETVRAKYLIAADGAKSDIRGILNLPFEGGTYESRFFLADVAVEGGVSRRHISLCLSQDGFAAFFPMYGPNRFRTVGVLPESVDEKANQDLSGITEEIRRQSKLQVNLSEPRWITTYRLHHRNIDQFKVGRCFFVGDAAHVHSPAGGQGMNTGIQDAYNLAWKLFWVLKGRAHETLLDTYHEERFPVARRLIHTTDQVFGFVSNRRLFFKWSRLYLAPSVLQALSKSQAFRAYVFRTISQIGIRYRKSSLCQSKVHFKSDLTAGDRFYQAEHDGYFHAFIVGNSEEQNKTIELLHSYFGKRIKIHTLSKHPESLSVLQAFGVIKDGLVFIRPDGYVGYCAEGLDLKNLGQYLDRYFLQEEESSRYESEELKSSSSIQDTHSGI